jgi:hypothetical protein
MKAIITSIAVLTLLIGCTEARAQQRHGTIAEQKICAAQAKKFYDETDNSNTKNTTKNEYFSHYDGAAKVCYVRIDVSILENNRQTTSSYVFDAFEGRTYAEYIWLSGDKVYWLVKPAMCDIKPIGGPKQDCTSTEEFEALVDKFFGLGE